jgi:hypothetical protein
MLIRQTELRLLHGQPVIPMFILSYRAYISYRDAIYGKKSQNAASAFLDNLNLTKEFHDVYFPSYPMRNYKLCERKGEAGNQLWVEVLNNKARFASEVHIDLVAERSAIANSTRPVNFF